MHDNQFLFYGDFYDERSSLRSIIYDYVTKTTYQFDGAYLLFSDDYFYIHDLLKPQNEIQEPIGHLNPENSIMKIGQRK